MNLISFQEFKEKIILAYQRFPLPLAIALTFTVTAIWTNKIGYNDPANLEETVFAITLTTFLLYPLSIGVKALLESAKAKLSTQIISNVGLIALFLISYFLWFKGFESWTDTQALTTALWIFSSFLFAFISPYILRRKDMEDFWQYTVKVIGKIILTVGFFALLFIGISILIASVDYLFDLRLDEDIYLNTFFILSGIAGQTFFLSLFPKKYENLDKEYPAGLKFIIQYLCVPLIIAYLIVLYIYSGSIVLTWNWPKGGVAIWIIVFCTAGVFTYYFSHSLKEVFHKYVEIFRSSLFHFIIPLTIVLFFAVGIRIADYGITETRYFGIVFGLWLLGISIYYIFSHKKELRVFPVTLIILILLSSYGPVSAFTISKNSQVSELKELLKTPVEDMTIEEESRASNIVEYLLFNHGLDSLKPVIGDISEYKDRLKWKQKEDILLELGIDSAYTYQVASEVYISRENLCHDCAIPIKGYQYYTKFYLNSYGSDLSISKKGVVGNMSLEGNTLSIKDIESPILNIDLERFITDQNDGAYTTINPKDEDLTFKFNSSFLNGELIIDDIDFLYKKAQHVNGYIIFNY